MRRILMVTTILFLLLLLIPLSVLVYRFTMYLLEAEVFKEWWVSIMWMFTLPVTTVLVLSLRKGDEK